MPSALLNRNHRDPLFPYTTLPQTSSVDVQSIICCYHQHNFTMPLIVNKGCGYMQMASIHYQLL